MVLGCTFLTCVIFDDRADCDAKRTVTFSWFAFFSFLRVGWDSMGSGMAGGMAEFHIIGYNWAFYYFSMQGRSSGG